MISKVFELKKNKISSNFFLLHGNNRGLIEEIINNNLKPLLPKQILSYDENDILKNTDNFKEEILNKSFFENKKLIIISRSSDKIFKIIEEIIERKVEDLSIIIKCSILDKKSKLRNYFEKNKNTVCIPTYEDNFQSLNQISQRFFKEKNINISQENINLIIERSRGDRMNLNNELKKIEILSINKKNISNDQILSLTNLAEDYSVSELVDSSLSKNKKKFVTILNENHFSQDDAILILRILLSKLKRLLKIQDQTKNNKNIDNILLSFKPPIFWKEKETVKQQVKAWNYEQIENLIKKTNNIEFQVKKNPSISINIITNFMLEQTLEVNN